MQKRKLEGIFLSGELGRKLRKEACGFSKKTFPVETHLAKFDSSKTTTSLGLSSQKAVHIHSARNNTLPSHSPPFIF
jgi:hypothetical protein